MDNLQTSLVSETRHLTLPEIQVLAVVQVADFSAEVLRYSSKLLSKELRATLVDHHLVRLHQPKVSLEEWEALRNKISLRSRVSLIKANQLEHLEATKVAFLDRVKVLIAVYLFQIIFLNKHQYR